MIIDTSIAPVRKGDVRAASGVRQRRVLVVGSGAFAERALVRLADDERIHVAGIVDNGGRHNIIGPLLGPIVDLEHLLLKMPLDAVHIALPMRSCYDEIRYALEVCERVGVEASFELDLFDKQERFSVREKAGATRLVLHRGPQGLAAAAKRAVDLMASLGGLVLLAPLMVLIAIAVRIAGPGPVLFRQERLGLNRRPFQMYKFRTMVANAEALQSSLEDLNEAAGPVFKIRRDPRVTPLGRLLRKSSLDELPQLFNVLRGEMSLVGPRPLPVRDAGRLSDPALMRRFSVKPGVTGLWQVNGRGNTDFECWELYDLCYVERWSLALDFSILIRTIPAVLRGTGAC